VGGSGYRRVAIRFDGASAAVSLFPMSHCAGMRNIRVSILVCVILLGGLGWVGLSTTFDL
jgi:threonine/homoserine efflux transporter RhtA